MIRYTTPSQEFVFQEDPQINYTRIVISYSQNNEIILEKEKSDLSFFTEEKENDTLYIASFRMTQEETAKFSPLSRVTIQIRVLTEDGNALASVKFECTVEDVLKKEVLYET